jgi:hypothetical protein
MEGQWMNMVSLAIEQWYQPGVREDILGGT